MEGYKVINVMEKNNAAKDLFLFYHGSHYQMARDMKYEEYEKYHISADTEAEWRKEAVEGFLKKIQSSNNNREIEENIILYSIFGRSIDDKKVVTDLFEYVLTNYKKLDTHTLMIAIKDVVNLAEKFKKDKTFFKKILNSMIDLFNFNIERGIFISKDYCVDGKNPRYLEEHELERGMKENLSYFKKLRDEM